MSDEQHGFLFTHEGSEYKLSKARNNYECWKNGVFKFGFEDKLSFHNHLYESLLTDCFGTKGFAGVGSVLDLHYASLMKFFKFLDLYGEEWK